MFTIKKDGAVIGTAGSHATRDDADKAAIAERTKMAEAAEAGRLSIEDANGNEVWAQTVLKRLDVG